MMGYADRQLELPSEEQYAAALGPPLFLTLTLLLAHLWATALGETDRLVATRRGLAGMINDDSSALIFRLLVFSIFALLMSLHFVWRRGLPVDRATLRLPFYARCYPAAVFALLLGSGSILAGMGGTPAMLSGAGVMGCALILYLIVEARWFAIQFDTGFSGAGLTALAAIGEGLGLLLAIALILDF
ncbi:hypothetical protein [Rhizorhabdus sp. FW153]|uniref:hypothetical protein n=1 Tax=Rhizorhabdus sp. FW153 TaxID=3400216 RepID=UPI003CEF117C